MFTVQRSYRNNNLTILEKKLGDKDSFVHMTTEGELDKYQLLQMVH